MKNFAIAILIVILLSIVVEPLVEIMEIGREKIILGTALTNSCRVTALNLEYDKLRDLDAKVNEEQFVEAFSEDFEDAMNVTRQSISGNTIVFSSNDDKFNSFTVTVNMNTNVDWITEQEVTEVKVRAETKYKFKTKYLQQVADVATDYILTSERMYVLSVKN